MLKEGEGEASVIRELDKKISKKEVKRSIKLIKGGKARGFDEVQPEFVKKGSKVTVKKVTELIKRVWDEETIPDEWGKGLVVPLYKGSGRRDDLHKYRGISLQCVLLKIMEGVVKRRLEKWAVSVEWLAEE